jgi:hypothetical protein
LNPDVTSLAQARDHISSTKELLGSIDVADTKLSDIKRIELGQGLYLELVGLSYVDDFLMPNFYFHMTTAYDIMRMVRAPIDKHDFMMHLAPFLKHQVDVSQFQWIGTMLSDRRVLKGHGEVVTVSVRMTDFKS